VWKMVKRGRGEDKAVTIRHGPLSPARFVSGEAHYTLRPNNCGGVFFVDLSLL
jgi:hypothetical protein